VCCSLTPSFTGALLMLRGGKLTLPQYWQLCCTYFISHFAFLLIMPQHSLQIVEVSTHISPQYKTHHLYGLTVVHEGVIKLGCLGEKCPNTRYRGRVAVWKQSPNIYSADLVRRECPRTTARSHSWRMEAVEQPPTWWSLGLP